MNLLTEPIFRTDSMGMLSLPEAFQSLSERKINVFPSLRPHQRTAWHMFLVQLGVFAIEHNGWPDTPEGWAKALRGLSEFGDDPWSLVVPDELRPAFMQSPHPEDMKWEVKKFVQTPDSLDILITAKNHDIKYQLAQDSGIEDWVFALVTLQTMEGYSGNGNFGISRMNGGSSSRPLLTAAPSNKNGHIDISSWWRRDVEILLKSRKDKTSYRVGRQDGIKLLWCEKWPEGQQLAVQDLDPLFIEICRRVRLQVSKGQIFAKKSTSKKARVDAKAFKGVLGDPWAPVDRLESKSLTIGSRDFDYRFILELTHNCRNKKTQWELPKLAKTSSDENMADFLLVAEALSRGNCKTEGLKSRVIPLPRSGSWYVESARDVANAMLDEIDQIEAALKEGLAIYGAKGDHEKVNKEVRSLAVQARKRFNNAVDGIFFEFLGERVQSEKKNRGVESQRRFCQKLEELARSEFKIGISEIPMVSSWEPRARARAEKMFDQKIRKSRLVTDQEEDESSGGR